MSALPYGLRQSISTGKKGREAFIVVATTTMLTDLVSQIGGDDVTVTGLMGPGVDPHLYQAGAVM